MKNKYIGTIIIFFVLLTIIILATINAVSREVDRKIEKIKLEAIDVIEGIKCEFTYRDLHYNGICTEELLDSMQELVGYDREYNTRMELLKICTSQPYAYRYELCEDLKAIK